LADKFDLRLFPMERALLFDLNANSKRGAFSIAEPGKM
jgi:hypothetical protein